MKPVSQGPVVKGAGRIVSDPDVNLIKNYFNLPHELTDMSPVVVPPGYTREFIDGRVDSTAQEASVLEASKRVAATSDTLVVEGTGHTGVGSIIGLNNAKVCKLIGADAVLVANGGLGSAFDDLELQRVMMKEHGVRLRGVVLNCVKPEKLEMVQDYFSKLVERNWGVPLLGCVPDYGFLGQPTLADLEEFFGGTLLTGHRDRAGHYPLERAHLVVTDLRRFMTQLEQDHQTRTLYITHCSRDDVILGFLSHCTRMRASGRGNFEAALLLCGHHSEDFYEAMQEAAHQADYPIMHVPLTTHATLLALRAFVPKLNVRDSVRSGAVIEHYEPFLNFDPIENP